MAGLLVTALAFYIYSPYLTLTTATGGTPASAGPATRVSPPADSPSPVASSTPAPSPTAPDPESHPGGQQPGIRLVATVRKGESVRGDRDRTAARTGHRAHVDATRPALGRP